MSNLNCIYDQEFLSDHLMERGIQVASKRTWQSIACHASKYVIIMQKPLPGSPVHNSCVCTVCAEIDLCSNTAVSKALRTNLVYGRKRVVKVDFQ